MPSWLEHGTPNLACAHEETNVCAAAVSHFSACMCTAVRTVSHRAVFTRDSPDTDTQLQTEPTEAVKTARKHPVLSRRNVLNL